MYIIRTKQMNIYIYSNEYIYTETIYIYMLCEPGFSL